MTKRSGAGAGLESLSAQEREIVRLVAEGKSNTEAAAVLSLSPRTVETYRIRIMRRLGLPSFAALVKFAIRNGLTTLD
jgi:DNA-binding CsgD family transcriptional regulator